MKRIVYKSSISRLLSGTLILFILIFGNTFYLNGQIQVPFTQRTSSYTPTKVIYNINGDFTMIGNTNLTLQNYSDANNNSNNIMIFVDKDADPATTNSSSATLNFSTENGAIPSCSNIIYAGLYWTGRTDASVTTATKRSIKIKGPGQPGYQSFLANANDIRYPGDNDMYAAYVEVTDLVRQYGIGEYWVADMALTAGNGGSTGYYGGWGMVVVYENSKMTRRDVTVFDGYAYVVGNTSIYYDLPISGFNTIQSGPVNLKLGLMAGEGDVGIQGDYLQIQKVSDGSWLTLNHSGNTANNFFNSSIYTGGNTRNPNLNNNTGVDISMFYIPNLNNTVITNNQTSTTFRYGSTQDTYIIFGMAMAVDAYIPLPEGLNTVQSIEGVPYISGGNQNALPGDEIEYKLDIRNKGSEPINNGKIVIPIPYASSYVSSSKVILYSPVPTPNNLYFNPLLGANGSIVWEIGTLPLPTDPNTILATLTYKIKVTEDCNLLSNNDCPPKIMLNGVISGTGAVSNVYSELGFIQGFQNQGPCGGVPIYNPIIIPVDAIEYLAQNCQASQNISFTYCNVGTSIPVTQVSGNFMPGSHFYNNYPVNQSTIEYTINNPFPATPGTQTYFSVPPGTTSCFYQFTINVTNINSTPVVNTAPVVYCQGEVAQQLTATPSNPSYILYYYETPTSLPQLSYVPQTSTPGVFTYYVAEGASSSCISPNKVPINVIINGLPNVTASNNGPVCSGTSLNLSSQGGVSYIWSGPNGFNSLIQDPIINNFSIAGTGTYSVTATDANGCSATDSTVVASPFLVTANAISGTISCNGGTTNIEVTATGGTAPYTGTGIFTVTAGTYNYTVTDANGCSSTTTITVDEPSTLSASSTAGTISCNGGTTVVTVTATGGTAPYTGTGIFTVTAGTYNYTVTDANGCTSTTTITVGEPSTLSASSTAGTISCNGGTTNIEVTATGGTAPYTGTGIFTVTAGTYNYTVTDANGCSSTTAITVGEPSTLTASSIAGTISCNGGTTVVTVTATGGTAPYTGTGIFTVTAGTYNYTVTDANGCSSTTTITVDEPSTLSASSTAGTISCNGGTTNIEVTATGGTAPYTGTGIFTVTAGTYNYTVTDANGCSSTTTITVDEPSTLSASSTAGAISCNGGTTAVTVTATGGTAPYTGTGIFTVTAGTYNYTVTDANGCSSTTTITVDEPSTLSASSTAGTISCNGGTTVVTVTATGGTAPYTGTGIFTVTAGTYNYTVTDANGCTSTTTITVGEPSTLSASSTAGAISCNGGTTVVTVTATGGTAPYIGTGIFTVTAGNYNYTVTDANGCSSTTAINVNEPSLLNLSLVLSSSASCNGGLAVVQALVDGGQAPYSFMVDGILQSGSIFNLSAGIHTIIVSDANGCHDTETININQGSPISLNLSVTTPISCYGNGNATVTATSTGTAPFTYKVDGITQNSNVFSLTAGTHAVSVTDANGCQANANITITQPSALTLTLTITNPVYCNTGTATVTATVTGGTTPYTYYVDGIVNSGNILQLTPGYHSVKVIDANGCQKTACINICPASPVNLCVTITSSIVCYGGTATVKAVASGGLAPYTYSADGGAYQSSNIFYLTAGTHTITVKDARGCTTTKTITLCQPCPFTLALNINTPITCNTNYATVAAVPHGGTSPYTYTVDGVAQNGSSFSMAPGTHVVVATDVKGCQATATITITQPQSVTFNLTITSPIACYGGTAVVTANIISGTGPYTYKVDGIYKNSNIFTLNAGLHTVVVTGANGCSTTNTINISQPTQLNITVNINSPVLCFGGTGVVAVNVTGGTAPYLYSVDGGSLQSNNLLNLNAGNHSITVKDANNCSKSICITVAGPQKINLCLSVITPIVCNGGLATIKAIASGGTAPYTYSADGGPYQTSNLFNLPAGTHTITVKDANGCTKSSNITITQPSPVIINVTINSPILCYGGTANITVTATGGTAPYTFTVLNNIVKCHGSYNLPAGTYTFIATDANGCSDSITITITQPDELLVNLAVLSAVSCNGAPASVKAIVTGGTSPYNYSLDGIAQSSNIFAMTVGTHTVVVTDANGCQKSATITITAPDPIGITLNLTSAVLCNGGTATVTATATGGTAPYMYSLNGGAYQSSNIFTLSAGTYTVMVKDAAGCTNSASITITQPSPIAVCLSVTSQIICNGGTASVSVLATGGTAPYSYSVDGGVFQTSNILQLTAGTHTITVMDANGCIKVTHITITQPVAMSLNLAVNGVITCFGGTTTVTAYAAGGVGPYSYRVDGGVYQTSNVLTVTGGYHTITVKDALGCEKSAYINITQPSEIMIVANITSAILCNGGSAVVTLTATGGVAPYLYSVDGSAYQNTNVFTLSGGSHTITVKDANGCQKTTNIHILEPAPVTITISEGTPACEGGISTITVNVTGGVGPYTYSIITSGVQQSKSANVFYLPSGTYTITVTDANGCTDNTTITVDCPDCNYITYTQGGWGAPANGNNPGVYLNANFSSAFPNGLTIGCSNKLRLTNAAAVTAFLPSGSTAKKLPAGTLTNPGNSYNNILAGQLVAAMLNVRFDQYDPNFSGSTGSLASLQIISGDFAGWNVAQLIDSANKFIGGCGSHYTAAQYNAALTAFNESYDGSSAKTAFLDCYNQGNKHEDIILISSGVEENQSTTESKPKVYPVPVSDKLNIDWNKGINLVEVYDVLGKLIYSEKVGNANHFEMDFGKYPKGIFNIRINGSEIVRIIK